MQPFYKFLKYLRGFFPMKLPSGAPEMDRFCQYIFDAYGLPSFPSYKNAIATIIMHLGPTTAYKAPFYFFLSVRKSMANQSAYDLIQRIREQEKVKAEEPPKEPSLEDIKHESSPEAHAHSEQPLAVS